MQEDETSHHSHRRTSDSSSISTPGRVIGCSSGPEPFPGVPIKQPLQPPQPGEVLIRYELEAASGCRLTAWGWCCFGTLCCIALPLSWLPFVCAFCKPQCQRPVYGYSIDFIGAAAADDAWPTKKASSTTAAPSIHCMDASLLAECAAAQQDQQQQAAQQLEQQRVFCAARCSPSPPPMSIFIPPSAVPACGFTPDNPFPSRYGDYSPGASPKHRAFGAPNLHTSTPLPGTGLPMVGMVDMGHHRRQLAQQAAAARNQAAVSAAAAAVVVAAQS